MPHSRETGLALVVVLFSLVMMTVLISWLAEDILLSVRRTENLRDAEQAYQIAAGSESWARLVLMRDAAETETDHSGESWNKLGKSIDIDHGSQKTLVEDLQGRFNINNLSAEVSAGKLEATKQPTPWTDAFRRLLLVLDLEEGLADAVLDWLDSDYSVRGVFGAEDSDYLALNPPYRAANRMLSDVSELLWIKGFSRDVLSRIEPYLAALPATGVRINVNTAPATILRILTRDILPENQAIALTEERTSDGPFTTDDFLRHDMMAGEQDAELLVTDRSSFFLIRSHVEHGRARFSLESTVRRDGNRVTVMQRRQALN